MHCVVLITEKYVFHVILVGKADVSLKKFIFHRTPPLKRVPPKLLVRKESEQHCLPKSNEKERGVRVLSLINVLEQPTPFLRPFVFAGKLLQSSNRTEVMEKIILGICSA